MADGMLSRWLTVIDTYDFKITHRKGSQMQHVDALSRITPRKCKNIRCVDCIKKTSGMPPDPSLSGQEVDPYQQDSASQSTDGDASVLCGALSSTRAEGSSPSSAIGLDPDPIPNWLDFKSKEELHALQLADPEIAIVYQRKESNDKPSKETINGYNQNTKTLLQQWDVLNIEGILYRKYEGVNGQSHLALVTPNSIRKEIFTELHINRTTGHFGRDRTVELIKRRFYWPNITDSVTRWCLTCDLCAQGKPGPGVGKYPLKQVKVSRRFQVVALDIFGPLPLTDNSNEYIVVIGDYFTKYIEAFAIPNHTALTVAEKLVTEVICRYGCMEQIHTDMGREF